MITRTEGARGVILGHEAKSKSIASCSMFSGVVLKVIPKVVGECVFRIRLRFKDASKFWAFVGELWKVEITPLTEPDKKNTLAVLGDDALRVDDLVIDRVAQCFGKGAIDNIERLAAVMAFEVLDVLQDKSCGTMEVEDLGDGEKEIALFFVVKAVLAPKAQLF